MGWVGLGGFNVGLEQRQWAIDDSMGFITQDNPENAIVILIRLGGEDRPSSGTLRLPEVLASSVVSQLNTLKEQPMIGVPVPVFSGQEDAQKAGTTKTSNRHELI